MDYPKGEATADTRLHIEFNDVGDGSSLPLDDFWAIARNKLQTELYNCLVMEDFARERLRKVTSTFETYLGQRPGRRP